jgi:peptidoglycan hydrolase-like protein with peptidoglycan-binding domain
MRTFSGKAEELTDLGIANIAAGFQLNEDHLHAVMEVETRGGGFFKDKRIKMLPEPHVFFRELGKGDKQNRAVKQGLAYRRWGTKPYPRSVQERYDRLSAMMEIDEEAALRSCSWGLGQIMGFNCKLAGYPTAAAMVDAFVDHENAHLEAMVEFIANAGLDDELRRLDWHGFARGYNGQGYKKHGYHIKLAKAYAKWQAIPDTPFKIDRSDYDPNPRTPKQTPMHTRESLYLGMRNSVLVADLQTILSGMGYHLGKVDGHFGTATKKAVMGFQSDRGIDTDGAVGPETWNELYEAQKEGFKMPIAKARAEATVKDVRAEGSQTISLADKGQGGAVATLGVSSVAALTNDVEKAQDALDTATEVKDQVTGLLGEGFVADIVQWAQANWMFILIALAAIYAWAIFQRSKEKRVEEHATMANPSR